MTKRITHSVYLLLACGTFACGSSSDGKSQVGDTGGSMAQDDAHPAGGSSTDVAGAAQGGAAQGGAAQGGAAQGVAAQGGAAQGGVAQGGVAQGGVAQGGAAQGGAAQGGAAQGGVAQGGAAQGGAAQGGAAQGGAAQGGAAQGGAAQGGAAQGGAAQGGAAQGGAAQGGAAEGGTAEGGGNSNGEGGTTTSNTTPSLGCGSPTTLMSGTATIDVNGVAREYILKLPSDYEPSQPYRLVFGWHQLAGSAEMIARMGYYGLEEPSAGQAIFVAPQGLFQITPSSGNLDAGWWNNDGEDVEFYHAMLERFTSELCIDESRIFSVGFSFGAMFSFTVACDSSGMIRAIAPMAGGGGRCDQRVAVMGFVGQQDGLLSGHVEAIERFAASNGCSGEPVTKQPSWCDTRPDDAACVCLEYQNCDEGYPAVSCEYTNGHMFAPNSGQTIWDFFSQF